MAQLLSRDGYRAVDDPAKAKVLIVNTCGFIGPAKQELIDVLREFAAGKRDGQILIAAGCLTQRYGVEIAKQVPGIDGMLGTRRWMDIVQVVHELRNGTHPEPLYHLPTEAATVGTDEDGTFRASVAGGSAYRKNCRWLSPSLRILCHPIDQRYGGQPADCHDHLGSASACGIWGFAS